MAIISNSRSKDVSKNFKKAISEAKQGDKVAVNIRKSLLYYLDQAGEIKDTLRITKTEDYHSHPKDGNGRTYKGELVKEVEIVKKAK